MDAWYYSTGGRQNGPVPLDELRRLRATGTVGATDLVWGGGMTDWKPAGEVPELSPAPPPVPVPPQARAATGPVNPYQVSASAWTADESAVAEPGSEIVPGSQPLVIGAILGRAWELTKRHFGFILLLGLIYFGLSFVAGAILGVVTLPFKVGESANGDAILSQPGKMIEFMGNIVSQIFDIFLSLGLTRIGLNIVSGKPFEFGMLFGEAGKLVNGVVAYLLFGLMVGVGLVLLIVPGIYVALRFGQFQCAIVDKNLGPIEALKYSAKLTEGNKMNLFGLGLMCFLIVLGGLLALVVGLLAALPVVYLASFIAYRWLQYGQAVAIQDPAPAPYR